MNTVHIWSPHFKKGVEKLERVQGRVTEIIKGLEIMSYSKRLKELQLFRQG